MSSAAVPPPESPFEARPAPSVISDSASAAAATPSDGVYATKPIPVEFPLTSFSSTPHNVAAFAFLLGACWSLGLVLAGANLSHWFLWTPRSVEHAASDLPKQALWYAVTHSPQLGMYLASWAVFHTLEFVVTSMYNRGKLTVSSYLLDNGKQYPLAHLAGMLEHVLEDAFLPAEYRRWKHVGGLFLLGLAITAFGQFLRSFAMISASSNFSHLLAYSKRPGHQLVTTGIYSWSRHPSYAGFFWWAVGTQILLGNPICAIVFVLSLRHFFSTRLTTEERYLVKFFGREYEDYRRRVPTRIPLVP